MKSKKAIRITLDIETEQFTDEFKKAESISRRLKLAPLPRIACVYNECTNHYSFFKSSEFDDLLEVIKKANKIITYNGTNFDFLVIQKHLKLKNHFVPNCKNIDMQQIISKKAGFRVSLNRAAEANLGIRKKYKGSKLGDPVTSMIVIMAGCKPDVSQTYRIFKLYEQGKLKIPEKKEKKYWKKNFDDYNEETEPPEGQNMPKKCRQCNSTLIFEPISTQNMSEGQRAEYEAGNWGEAYCPKCKKSFDWDR
jgi:hypothetical protein